MDSDFIRRAQKYNTKIAVFAPCVDPGPDASSGQAVRATRRGPYEEGPCESLAGGGCVATWLRERRSGRQCPCYIPMYQTERSTSPVCQNRGVAAVAETCSARATARCTSSGHRWSP